MHTQSVIGTTRAVRYLPHAPSPHRLKCRMPRSEFEQFRTAAMHRIPGTRYDEGGNTHLSLPAPDGISEGVDQGAELALNLLLAVRQGMRKGEHTRISALLAAVAAGHTESRAGFDRFTGFCDVLETALRNYVTTHDPIVWAQADRYSAGARVAAGMVS